MVFFYFTDPPCCQTFNYRVPSQFLIKQCQTTSFNLFNGFQKPTDKLFIPAFLFTKLHGSNSGEIKSMHFYLQSDLPSPKKAQSSLARIEKLLKHVFCYRECNRFNHFLSAYLTPACKVLITQITRNKFGHIGTFKQHNTNTRFEGFYTQTVYFISIKSVSLT